MIHTYIHTYTESKLEPQTLIPYRIDTQSLVSAKVEVYSIKNQL